MESPIKARDLFDTRSKHSHSQSVHDEGRYTYTKGFGLTPYLAQKQNAYEEYDHLLKYKLPKMSDYSESR